MTATVIDGRLAAAAHDVARFQGMNLVIGDNDTVHGVSVITDRLGLPRVIPACNIGWSGGSQYDCRPVDPATHPIDCERVRCPKPGDTVPAIQSIPHRAPAPVSYAEPEPLFELGADGDLADEFAEFELTVEEFDARTAAAEPVELAQTPIPGLDHRS